MFLSYASEDAASALLICKALRSVGIEVWFDQSELRGGDAWDAAIRNQIKSCALFIPILSANTHKRIEGYFRLEWKLAIDRSHRLAPDQPFLIPVAIDQTSQSDERLPERFRELQWIRLPDGNATPVFVERITNLLSPDISAVHLAHPRAGDTTTGSTAQVRATTERAKAVSPQKMLPLMALAILVGVAALALYRLVISKHDIDTGRPPARTASIAPAARLSSPEKSVAVLPFLDLSEAKDQEYFSDGMAEEVLDLLANLPGIRVIGRTSSFQFKGKNADLREIGAELGAGYLVEGSVRKSGNRLRVTAQLIGSREGSPLWSETYDEKSGDILLVQTKIASALVRALQVTIGADDLQPRQPLKNPAAYDLYLRGRHSYDRFDRVGFESAANYFQQALLLEPESVRAAEWLAMTDESMAEWGFRPPRQGFEQARASTLRALKLDPRSTLAHTTMCAIKTIYDWDWSGAMKECQLALAIEPRNPLALATISQPLMALGQVEDARRALTQALGFDPMVASSHVLLGNLHRHAGAFADAETEFRRALDISPAYVAGHYYLGVNLLAEGRNEAALLEMQQEVAEGGRDVGVALAYYAMNRRAESDEALARVPDDWAYEKAAVYAYRDDRDKAMKWLYRAFDSKDPSLCWIKTEPLFNSLKGDPRYAALLRKMGLPE